MKPVISPVRSRDRCTEQANEGRLGLRQGKIGSILFDSESKQRWIEEYLYSETILVEDDPGRIRLKPSAVSLHS